MSFTRSIEYADFEYLLYEKYVDYHKMLEKHL